MESCAVGCGSGDVSRFVAVCHLPRQGASGVVVAMDNGNRFQNAQADTVAVLGCK